MVNTPNQRDRQTSWVDRARSVWLTDVGAPDYCASVIVTDTGSEHLVLVKHDIIALDGDRAGSETYFHSATRLMQDGEVIQIRVWGRYLHEWSRRDGQWRIDKRLTLFAFDEIRQVTEMVRRDGASRDRTDPSYAVLKGL
jgi:hypothetical protein